MRTLALLPLLVVFGLLLVALVVEALAAYVGEALEGAYDRLHALSRRRSTQP